MTRSTEELEERLRRVLDAAAGDLHVGPATWDGPRSPPRGRLRRPGVGGAIALAGAALAILVAVVALASLHDRTAGVRHRTGAPASRTGTRRLPSSSTPRAGSTTTSGVTAASVERALLRQRSSPRPTAVSCRTPTGAERAAATIGGASSTFFSCSITRGGQAARFYVQVLTNGSFIAEQEDHRQTQMFGCCVPRPSR